MNFYDFFSGARSLTKSQSEGNGVHSVPGRAVSDRRTMAEFERDRQKIVSTTLSPYTTGDPPGRSRGLLPWLREAIGGWTGAKAKNERPGYYVTTEKTAGGPRGVKLPAFLPFIDEITGETDNMRLWYRRMLRDPIVKAALLGKVLDVGSLDLHVNPPDNAKSKDRLCANFCNWNINSRVSGRVAKMAVDVCLPGLVDGYSLSEKVWQYHEHGQYEGYVILDKLKSKDTGNDVVLVLDEFRNVVGVLGLRYNAGLVFSPSDFALFRYLSIFDYPGGMSDLRAAYSCYSSDTEVLTDSGWKLFTQLTDDDKVATLNPMGQLEYEKPTERYNAPYKGKMFHQGGRNIDLMVTPNHRMWVRSNSGSSFRFVTAEKLMDGSISKTVKYKRNVKWVGEERSTFMLPGIGYAQSIANKYGEYQERTTSIAAKELPMDDWLRFLGIWISDGCTYRSKSKNNQCYVVISQNTGEVLDEIKRIVERLGFHYTLTMPSKNRTVADLRISNLQLYTYLKELGKSYTKYIPREYMSLCSRQLQLLLDWLLIGDGRHDFGNGKTQYATVSKRLANDVSEVIFKTGKACNISRETMKLGSQSDKIFIVAINVAGIDATCVNRTPRDDRSWVDYDGTVHCVTTRNGIIYVRRGGKACFSGNSYWMLDTCRKLRSICLEKRAMPVMIGTYKDLSQRPALENVLSNIRWNNWVAAPEWAKVQALEWAGQAVDLYNKTIEDLKQDIFIGIQGAFLQALEGSNPGARGNAQVQRSTSDLFKWYLMSLFLSVINEQVLTDLTDLNFAGLVGYPEAVMGGIDEGTLKAALDIDTGLQTLGLSLSKKALYKKYGREEPIDQGDELKPPGGGGDQPGGGNGPGANGGDGVPPSGGAGGSGGSPPGLDSDPANTPAGEMGTQTQETPTLPNQESLQPPTEGITAAEGTQRGQTTEGATGQLSQIPPTRSNPAPMGGGEPPGRVSPIHDQYATLTQEVGKDAADKVFAAAQKLLSKSAEKFSESIEVWGHLNQVGSRVESFAEIPDYMVRGMEEQGMKFDSASGKWVTLSPSGTHVQLDGQGNIAKGPPGAKDWGAKQKAKPSEGNASHTPETPKKDESKLETKPTPKPEHRESNASVEINFRGVDPKYKKQFEKATRQAWKNVLGNDNPKQVASLVGAPDDAKIAVRSHDANTLSVDVKHPDYDAHRIIGKDHEGKKYIKNDEFFLKPSSQGKGLGTKIFSDQIEQAKKDGVSYIKCHAAKTGQTEDGKPLNGYYTWPRMGYDMDLEDMEEADAKSILKKFPKAQSIQDVMATKEGRDWWKENGFDLEKCKFDLTPGSKSLKILEAYQRERAAQGK